MTAKALVAMAGATTIVGLDAENQRFIGWTPSAPNDGFPLKVDKAISSMFQQPATLHSLARRGRIPPKRRRLLPHLLYPRRLPEKRGHSL